MPGGNGTGPMGMGPMTGRAAGFCAGYGTPGFANPAAGRGRGFGGGRGYGRGRGRGFGRAGGAWAGGAWAGGAQPYGVPYAPQPMPMPQPMPAPTPEQEAMALKAQAEQLGGMLADIRKRLDELEAVSAGGEQ